MRLIDPEILMPRLVTITADNGESKTEEVILPGDLDNAVVDAEPVVRCKDCKHFKRDIPCVGGTYNGCGQLEGRDGCEPYVEEDFFCAYGERRPDERSD